MDTMEELAKQILDAMRIREESFDYETITYRKSFRQAAAESGRQSGLDSRSDNLVHTLIVACWNDAEAWATSALKPDPNVYEEKQHDDYKPAE